MTPPAASAAPIPASRPRRISGGPREARILASGAVAAPGVARPRTRTTPGRARVAAQPQPRTGESLLERLAKVSDHRLLDRLIRGRLWIGVLAFALIGIVAMQLAILSLNRGIGQALQRVDQLQRENPALTVANSTAVAGETVEPQAQAAGMRMVSAGGTQFLTPSLGTLARATQILKSGASASTTLQSTLQQSEATHQPAATQAGETEAAQAPSGEPGSGAEAARPSETSSERLSLGASEAASSTSGQGEAAGQSPTSASSTAAVTVGVNTNAQAPAAITAGGGTQAGP